MVLLLAALFVALSLWYFLNTRWYLFPLLYLNFAYFGHRFVYVQDDSYLAMLVVVMIALVLARSRREASHLLMALAITMKLSPAAYAREILTMRRGTAIDLRRHPVRRFRAALFHLGQLPDHLHVPRPGQRQHLRHDRGGRAGRALHDCAVVRRDATRVRHGGSDRVVARSVRDVRRHQDAGRPAPADRAPGAGQAGSAQHRGSHRPRALRRGSGCVPARVGALHHDRSALRIPGATICGESAGPRFATTRGIRCAPSGCCCRSPGQVLRRRSVLFGTRLP